MPSAQILFCELFSFEESYSKACLGYGALAGSELLQGTKYLEHQAFHMPVL